MARIILPFIASALLLGLLWAEKAGSYPFILLFKAPLSSLFVLVAAFLPHQKTRYFRLVIAGLIFGLVGDICLALPGNIAFRSGLVAFLVGHVLYVIAFMQLTRRTDWVHLVNLIILAVSGYVLWWLWPYLGAMLVPVLLYIIVISVMLSGAWAVFRNPKIGKVASRLILFGALLFYISDVFVARNRFVETEFLNRLVGLPLYYIGQFLLAFSAGLVRPNEGRKPYLS